MNVDEVRKRVHAISEQRRVLQQDQQQNPTIRDSESYYEGDYLIQILIGTFNKM